MRTSKPISTISYNSKDFLISVLDSLVDNKIIEFWFFVYHNPEDDEAKGHFHVFMEPAKMLQTMDLKPFFNEPDPSGNVLPLGIINIESSKFDDAYLYFVHDRDYLASKNQSRKYNYSLTDVVSNDLNYLRERVRRIDMTKITPYARVREAIAAGMTWSEFLVSGRVPINLINAYKTAFEAFFDPVDDPLYRAGRKTHTPIDDDDESEGPVRITVETDLKFPFDD